MLESFRSALRQIRRNPGFAVAVVLTLAIGIGATTAVFTLADPMLFRPLPFEDADRLVRLRVEGGSGPVGSSTILRLADAVRMAEQHQGIAAVCQFATSTAGRLEGLGDETVIAYSAQDGCGMLLGQPVRGRLFTADEFGTRERMPAVALVTHRFWESAMGAAEDVIGRRVQFAGPRPQSFEIIGVLPPTFMVPQTVNAQPALILPVHLDTTNQGNWRFGADPIAKLKAGVSIDAAQSEAQRIITDVEREYAEFPQGRRLTLVPLRDSLFGPVRTPLLMLLAATACALLLASANLAQLFLARLHARQREIGVRLALGISRWGLVRHFVTEAAVLAVLGGAAALVVAQWTFTVIMATTPDFSHVYRLLPASVDLRVIGFAMLLTGAAFVIYGVAPSLQATRADVRAALQTGGTTTPAWGRRDAVLIFLQTAMALALLVTGSLIVRSYVYLTTQDLGFEPDQVRSVSVELAPAASVAGGQPGPGVTRQRIYESLRARLPVPVALAGGTPGLTLPARGDRPDVTPPQGTVGRLIVYPASGTFFEVMGLRRTRGRLFTEEEAFANAAIAVVDERTALTLWPGEDPLGKSIVTRETANEPVLRTVIGVVATVRMALIDDDEAGTAYMPFSPRTLTNATPLVRPGRREPSLEEVRAAVHEVVPGVRVTVNPVRPFERALGQPRFLASLLGTLSVIAVALTIVGIFGIVNHEVARRTREVGIRMALGADAARIRRLVLLRALVPAALGVAIGSLLSFWWTPSLQAILHGLQSHDLASFAMAGGVVLVTVLAAGLIPAWRASRLQPTEALRAE